MLQLRRIVSSESWIPEIDGLRFVAILAVLIFHAAGEVTDRGNTTIHIFSGLQYLIVNGDRGVPLFFVISGFVLARPFFHQYRLGGKPIHLRFYFLRRLTRLEPPFLLSLAIYCVAWIFIMHSPLGYVMRHTLYSAAYVHNLVYPGMLPFPNFVTWSLEVEVQFYILAPLLGQIYRLKNTAGRRSVWVALVLVGCTWSGFHTKPPITLLSHAGFFPAGFLLADIFDSPSHKKSLGSERYVWDFVGLIGWIAIFLLPPNPVIRAFLPIIIVPVYLTVFHGKLSRALFRKPLLTTIGGMCYSFYLFHPLVISAAFRPVKHIIFANGAATFFVQTLLLLAATFPVSVLYFVLVERPCMNKHWPQDLMRWLQSITQRSTVSPVP